MIELAGGTDVPVATPPPNQRTSAQGYALTALSLPNMFTAGAVHGIGWSLLD